MSVYLTTMADSGAVQSVAMKGKSLTIRFLGGVYDTDNRGDYSI